MRCRPQRVWSRRWDGQTPQVRLVQGHCRPPQCCQVPKVELQLRLLSHPTRLMLRHGANWRSLLFQALLLCLKLILWVRVRRFQLLRVMLLAVAAMRALLTAMQMTAPRTQGWCSRATWLRLEAPLARRLCPLQ